MFFKSALVLLFLAFQVDQFEAFAASLVPCVPIREMRLPKELQSQIASARREAEAFEDAGKIEQAKDARKRLAELVLSAYGIIESVDREILWDAHLIKKGESASDFSSLKEKTAILRKSMSNISTTLLIRNFVAGSVTESISALMSAYHAEGSPQDRLHIIADAFDEAGYSDKLSNFLRWTSGTAPHFDGQYSSLKNGEGRWNAEALARQVWLEIFSGFLPALSGPALSGSNVRVDFDNNGIPVRVRARITTGNDSEISSTRLSRVRAFGIVIEDFSVREELRDRDEVSRQSYVDALQLVGATVQKPYGRLDIRANDFMKILSAIDEVSAVHPYQLIEMAASGDDLKFATGLYSRRAKLVGKTVRVWGLAVNDRQLRKIGFKVVDDESKLSPISAYGDGSGVIVSF